MRLQFVGVAGHGSHGPLFPLEAELGILLAEHGDVSIDVPQVVEPHESVANDITARFVREMYELEGRMNYVGYGMLCSQWMLDWGSSWNEHECRSLVDEYQDTGIVERFEVFSIPTGRIGPRPRCI